MRQILLATTFLALAWTAPAFAQRSLFDQPVANPPAAPAAPAPAAPAPAPAPSASAPPAAAAPAEPVETAAPRAKAKPKKPRGPVPARSLSVHNATPTALTALTVSQDGRAGQLRKPLAPGKKTRLSLPAFKACEVTVTSTFEGQAASAPATVDICKEKVLNFKD